MIDFHTSTSATWIQRLAITLKADLVRARNDAQNLINFYKQIESHVFAWKLTRVLLIMHAKRNEIGNLKLKQKIALKVFADSIYIFDDAKCLSVWVCAFMLK